jgi:hypothetical protein
MWFDDQSLHLHIKGKSVWLAFKDKKSGKENLKHCFDLELPADYFTEDHDSYIFLSGYSGEQLGNEMLVHNVKFYDTNHLHDKEGQDTADEKRDFHGKGKDVLRQTILS